MSLERTYPIGTPGQPWGPAEVAEWLAGQVRQRSHRDDVVARIDALRGLFDVTEYGRLEYGGDPYPLLAIRSRDWRDDLPWALVTGGVHGYETSGVHGALQFLEEHAAGYAGRINLMVVPCVSPWGYEHVQRWNPHAVDPNRSFKPDGEAQEATALMRLVAGVGSTPLLHIDLHETTDTDESEFRPALAARNGVAYVPDEVPDGFYLVGDSLNPQPAFQQALIEAVARVTHIAPPDRNGQIIRADMASPGVINYPVASLGLCAGLSGARFTTTTEVYPDSPRATPQQCNEAQVAAVRAALEFALTAPGG